MKKKNGRDDLRLHVDDTTDCVAELARKKHTITQCLVPGNATPGPVPTDWVVTFCRAVTP